ncbi:hypothetical protein ACWD2L_00605 [Streptomyces sp. NPDC002754]
MLLITRAADDIELTECADSGCEFVCMADEREDLGWGQDFNGDWLCEADLHAWADALGLPLSPRRRPAAV